MPPLPFSLLPFPGEAPPPSLSVSGTIERTGEELAFRIAFSGPLSLLSIPPPASPPMRRHGLWTETCAELFLREEGRPGYVEVNLSPAGHWNAYRFDAPRSGLREEPSLPALPFEASRHGETFSFSLDIPLSPLFPAAPPLRAAVSAVVRTVDGSVSHWALAHPAARPDFHRPEAFLLRLPPAG